MSEDFQRDRHASASHPVVILMTLKDIDNYLQSNSKSLNNYPDLPQLQEFEHIDDVDSRVNRLLEIERSYDRSIVAGSIG
jgi:hypothetical protein